MRKYSHVNRKAKEFINYVKQQCYDYNINIYFGKGKKLRIYSGYCTGYFTDEKYKKYDGRLCIATNRRFVRWFEVLIHEYAHMTQWIDGYELWYDDIISTGESAFEIFDQWVVEKKNIKKSVVDEAFSIIIELERDCDIRATKIIKKYKLPINVKLYKKRSNAYHYWYHVCKKTRKSVCKPEMYRSKKVLDVMPDHFRNNTIELISKDKFNVLSDFFK